MQCQRKGFTLVEMIVAVAILAILAPSAYFGLNGFMERREVVQASKIIKDIVVRYELEVLTGIGEVELIFFPNFIVSKEEHGSQIPELRLSSDCENEGVVLEDSGYFSANKKSGDDWMKNIEASEFEPFEYCFDFSTSPNIERAFALHTETGEKSIRFIHFNVNRDKQQQAKIDTENISVKINSYGHKKIYQNGNLVDTVQLEVSNPDDESNTTTINL